MERTLSDCLHCKIENVDGTYLSKVTRNVPLLRDLYAVKGRGYRRKPIGQYYFLPQLEKRIFHQRQCHRNLQLDIGHVMTMTSIVKQMKI